MPTATLPRELVEKARRIRLLALDVDGVLTDGRMYFTDDGEAMKAFNILDGHGIKMLMNNGVKVAIVTGRKSGIVEQRARELGIELVFQGCVHKPDTLAELVSQENLDFENVAFMGDDLPDLACLRKAGLSIAPANAHPSIQARVDCVTTFRGGDGAVRQACDWILQAQGSYEASVETFL